MTPEEIDVMPAGRNMDLLVCAHIFGHRVREWTAEDKTRFAELLDSGKIAGGIKYVPVYSTDEVAALEVLRALAKLQPTVALEHSDWNTEEEWFCGWSHGYRGCHASTIALAICRAFLVLKAVK
jgi:hypothetical protein